MKRLLVHTRTTDYRHAAIPAAVRALREALRGVGCTVDATEDPAALEEGLDTYGAVVFLLTSGDILTDASRNALQKYVDGGGGFAGVHSAACTETTWPYYGELLGARFTRHPAYQPGRVRVVDRDHRATRHLPPDWSFTDEWYDFDRFPVGARVLAHADETSYDRGASGGTAGTQPVGHPLIWCRTQGAGRVFYTALGHAEEAYTDPRFLAHLTGGLTWAAAHT